jgi:hypothetical protein
LEIMHMKRHSLLAAVTATALASPAFAAPYASSVSITGTTVTFTLNEDASNLSYRINGGLPILLDGATKGTKTFNLNSPSDTFSITASKVSGGYAFANGSTTATSANGLSVPTANSSYFPVSSDSNPFGRFNSPRGVAVNQNPNAGPLFGVGYVANSAAGTVAANAALGAPARTLGDGLYGIKADGSDATGRGDTASVGPTEWGLSASAPFRISVGADNNVYIADFADSSGFVGYNNPALSSFTQVLAGNGNPVAGSNHGNTLAVAATGSLAQGNLVLYTVDEDLTDASFGGTNSTAKNNLYRYDIGAGPFPSSVTPTKINQAAVLITGATADMDIGKDGKFYLAQNRNAGTDGAGITVLDASGAKIYDSLTDSRAMLGSSTAPDIIRNVLGMAVSPDQKYMALMLNNSDVAVVPLVNGIPDIANRLLIDTGPDINSGRDIAFDAANNIHYVSSGQGIYRILSPGGGMSSTLTWDGNSFSFSAVPEPATAGLLGVAACGLLLRRRRAAH